jgi:hypothetical protein
LSVNEAAQKLIGKRTTIVTVEGNEHRGVVKDLTYEDIVYQPDGAESPVIIPLTSVAELEMPPPAVEVLGGGLIGCMAGAAAGYAIAEANATGSRETGLRPFGSEKDSQVMIGTMLGGLAGCGLGVAAVATMGGDAYDFPLEESRADSVAKEKP